MKLTVQNGVMSATAETLADMQQLFKLTANGSSEKKPVGRPVGFSPKKNRTSRHKAPCAICGKNVLHMGLHLKRNHSARPVAPAATEANTW